VPAEAGIRWSTVDVPVIPGTRRVAGRAHWRSLTKGTCVFGTAIVLAAGSLLARSESREKHHEVTELAGVKLGMTPHEVVAALGEPTYIDRAHRRAPQAGKRKRDDTAFGYVYGRSYDPDYSLQLVFFDGESPRLGIACEVHAESSALGLSNGAKERVVVHKLGKPDKTSISADRKQKIISYPQWKVAYFIEKRLVVGVCISDEGVVTFVDSA
jgi:hypothetical protein